MADFEGWINVCADAIEEFGCASSAISPTNWMQRERFFQSEGNVFSDGEIGKEGGLLVNCSDTEGVSGAWRESGNLLAIYIDAAGVRLVGTNDPMGISKSSLISPPPVSVPVFE